MRIPAATALAATVYRRPKSSAVRSGPGMLKRDSPELKVPWPISTTKIWSPGRVLEARLVKA